MTTNSQSIRASIKETKFIFVMQQRTKALSSPTVVLLGFLSIFFRTQSPSTYILVIYIYSYIYVHIYHILLYLSTLQSNNKRATIQFVFGLRSCSFVFCAYVPIFIIPLSTIFTVYSCVYVYLCRRFTHCRHSRPGRRLVVRSESYYDYYGIEG